MGKSFVVHPILFAIFPVLFLIAHNIREVIISEAWLPLAILIGTTLLLLLILSALIKSRKKAGIVLSLALIPLFSYGPVFSYVKSLVPQVQLQSTSNIYLIHLGLLISWSVLITVGSYFIIKARRDFHNVTILLNVAGAALIFISLVNIGVYKLQDGGGKPAAASLSDLEFKSAGKIDKDSLPDIYYIVLDRYGNENVLKEFYNFDNSEFTGYLSEKGFYVAKESRCNYPSTSISLASSLNIIYPHDLYDSMSRDVADKKPIFSLLKDNRVTRFLKSNGYQYIHFGSWYGPTRENTDADKNYNLVGWSEFSKLLFKNTMLYPVFAGLGLVDFNREQYKRVLYKFDRLSEMPEVQGPKFVFAHMLIPHPPYVFDRDGQYLSRADALRKGARENYLNQVIFVNRKLTTLINRLISESKRPPAIILQADEGPYLTPSDNAAPASTAALRKRSGILNAYFLPGTDGQSLYPNISPVNSFRLIFNSYFNTELEMLPDRTYASLGGQWQPVDWNK